MFALNSQTVPRLPYDVLRQLFQTTAHADRSTALCLALLSRAIQPWIDEIIYESVILDRQSTARAFLRTLRTAKTKPRGFFANYVKSLFICPDIDPVDVVTLLSACRGVVNLSYWPLVRNVSGGGAINSRLRNANLHDDPWESRSPSPTNFPLSRPPFSSSQNRRESRIKLGKFSTSVAVHDLQHLSPRRLSVLLHENHPLATFQPTSFDIPFFASVTHLTIVNRWEEWTSWAGGAISSLSMPHLTHVKFDLAVGQAPQEDVSRSRARWLNTVTDGWSSADSESCPSVHEEKALSAWTRKISRVAGALTDVLNHTQFLEVCVLVLRFESNPARTAKQISRLVSTRINEDHFSGFLGLGGDASMAEEQTGFDPRLVFAWEKEPFRYSHAHSAHESMIWRAAEAVAKAQRYMAGYTDPLDTVCTYLIMDFGLNGAEFTYGFTEILGATEDS
ncbi:hypothetical protein BDZ97DRAFT_2071550 [Flammula alnicola]|nr:hypothetical protein BDZ97DRAFT_2071550 [Flammula alnicola]